MPRDYIKSLPKHNPNPPPHPSYGGPNWSAKPGPPMQKYRPRPGEAGSRFTGGTDQRGRYDVETKLTIKGADQIAKLALWVGLLPLVLNDTRIFAPSIQAIGKGLADRWDSEEGWARLAMVTRAKRAERGYGPEHPILEQSGGLAKTSWMPLYGWRSNQGNSNTVTRSAAYDNSSDTIFTASITAGTGGGRFTATVSGDKVTNQYGGRFRNEETGAFLRSDEVEDRSGYYPARPFFYIPNVDYTSPMVGEIENQWHSLGQKLGLRMVFGEGVLAPIVAPKPFGSAQGMTIL